MKRATLPVVGLPLVVVSLLVAQSVFFGVLLLLGLDEEDRELLELVRRRIAGRRNR